MDAGISVKLWRLDEIPSHTVEPSVESGLPLDSYRWSMVSIIYGNSKIRWCRLPSRHSGNVSSKNPQPRPLTTVSVSPSTFNRSKVRPCVWAKALSSQLCNAYFATTVW